MAKHLVVARHREDTGWYQRIPAGWNLLEVQKGRELPNTGREASSYLWAILHLYDRLAADDLVAFVQGDPFQHCIDIDLFLLLDRPTDGYRAFGDYHHVSGGDGGPKHVGLPIAERYEAWLGDKWPGAVRFAPGAQFVVTGANITSRPKNFYQRILDDIDDKTWAWVLERLWPSIFPPLTAETPLATFYCQATPVTTYLRCELPARYLPGKVSRECPVAQNDTDYWFPDHNGAAVFQFAGDANWALMVHGLQAKGVRVLMESDDNYFTVHPSMHKTGWGKTKTDSAHSLEGHASILKWVDGCIVTTETLAKQYRKHNPNVYVAPNTVDPQDWPAFRKPDDGMFRIGWFASNSHTDDAKLVRRGLEWASKQDGVEIVTMGMNPTWWDFRRKHIRWQELPAYREALHQLDVGLAPVVGTPWAVCRSDLKALEYGIAGAAPVLSDAPPYSTWKDGETCLKARDAREFYHRIKWLVANRDEAKALAVEARTHVLAERTTARQIWRWREAIEDKAEVKAA